MKIKHQVYCFYLIALCLVSIQIFMYISGFIPLDLAHVMNHPALNFLYSDLLSILEIMCSLLIFLYLHDYKILKQRQQTGESAHLDLKGITEINQNFQLDTVIIHEDSEYRTADVDHHHSSLYQVKDLANKLQQFEQYQKEFDINAEGIPRKAEDYLHVCTLPGLPSIFHENNRTQVGLFAVQEIPQWSLFYWVGDIDMIHHSKQALLSSTTQMNRRTLASIDDVSFFQAGSSQQRSGCGVLANFFWCHTQSMPKSMSPYWILPSHFLGEPNCVYVTTKKNDKLCSALLTFKGIESNEQLLMFTGSDQEVKTVDRWIRVYKIIPILVGGSLLLTALKFIALTLIFL